MQLTPEEFAQQAYAVLLGREIDPDGAEHLRGLVASKSFDEIDYVAALVASPEYKERQFRREPFGNLLHRARQEWAQQLPPAQRILDIGGSSPTVPEGALTELGYPHRPKRLTIFDLPPEQQFHGKPEYEQRSLSFDWGRVEYLYGRAEDLPQGDQLQDARFDLVFMGQAIEHLEPEALPALLVWIREHLTEGGRFIFDTPNRAITKLHHPGHFIDPDHKTEYEPAQLQQILEQAGLSVVREWGMVSFSRSLEQGAFDLGEAYQERPLLQPSGYACYLFGLDTA